MKTVISGRLIKKPELKRVVLKDGAEEVVCDYSLWVSDASAPVRTGSDGKPHKADIPFSCTAWGDNAREIAASRYRETDRISGICDPQDRSGE